MFEERHADPIDEATALAAALTDGAIAAATRRANEPETHPDFDGIHCVEEDCGEPLPPGRLAMKRIRCVHCQERKELRDKQKGGGAWSNGSLAWPD